MIDPAKIGQIRDYNFITEKKFLYVGIDQG